MVFSTVQKRVPSLKEDILDILSIRWPLTLNEIHQVLKEKYHVQVTYQAVRKAVMILTAAGQVEAQKKKYALSRAWIEKMRLLIETVARKYGVEDRRSKKYDYLTVKSNSIEEERNNIKIKALFKTLIPIYQEAFPKHNIFRGQEEDAIITYLLDLQKQSEIIIFFLQGIIVGGTALVKGDEDQINKFIRWRLKHFAISNKVHLKDKLKFLAAMETKCFQKRKTVKIEYHMAENEKENLALFKKAGYVKESIYLNRYRLGEKAYNYSKILSS